MLTGDSIIKKNPRVIYRELGDAEGGVLLRLETGQYHGLNRMGARIWRLMDGVNTMTEIILRLREGLSDPPGQLEDDVWNLVRSLQERDIIRLDRA